MRIHRLIRGTISTAMTWAIGWAVIGGALVVGWQSVCPSFPSAPDDGSLGWMWGSYWQGAVAFAIAGALAGCLFSIGLVMSARSITLASLSYARMFGLGALGGVGVVAVLGLAERLAAGVWAPEIVSVLGIAAILGGASAGSMLRLARAHPGGEQATADMRDALGPASTESPEPGVSRST